MVWLSRWFKEAQRSRRRPTPTEPHRSRTRARRRIQCDRRRSDLVEADTCRVQRSRDLQKSEPARIVATPEPSQRLEPTRRQSRRERDTLVALRARAARRAAIDTRCGDVWRHAAEAFVITCERSDEGAAMGRRRVRSNSHTLANLRSGSGGDVGHHLKSSKSRSTFHAAGVDVSATTTRGETTDGNQDL